MPEIDQIPESELILNPDGSIYHLNLHPEDISDLIINVGDPDRVKMVSDHFDEIELEKQKREFVTHTGIRNGRRISVISTGIGTDNIDIVYNELDALANIDFETRKVKTSFTGLKLVRIGTSGSLQKEIPVGSFVCSRYGLGLDGLMHHYEFENTSDEQALLQKLNGLCESSDKRSAPYIFRSDDGLFDTLSKGINNGITASCQGFYGPQQRTLRLKPADESLIRKLSSFSSGDLRITNFEMETSAMFGLSSLLGHASCSVNVILANRTDDTFSDDPYRMIDELIVHTLDRLT